METKAGCTFVRTEMGILYAPDAQWQGHKNKVHEIEYGFDGPSENNVSPQ